MRSAIEDFILYELHTGTFTPERTFDGAIGRLPYLRELGVTAIELMPVAAFPGARNWGYDGAYLYAPHAAYGGPLGLKRLVDACRYTMPGNETGLPGLSVPAGLDRDGLPIGAMLYANFAREDVLLQAAAQLERARPAWFGQVPPVHVTRA